LTRLFPPCVIGSYTFMAIVYHISPCSLSRNCPEFFERCWMFQSVLRLYRTWIFHASREKFRSYLNQPRRKLWTGNWEPFSLDWSTVAENAYQKYYRRTCFSRTKIV